MGRRPDVALSVRCGKAEMQFGILGPLEARDGEGPVRVPGAKERALLADLLVHAGRVVAADRLVEDLWGEQPPGNPANTLQGRVSALRRALGPAGSGLLLTRPPGYALAVGPEAVDAARFERLVAEAEAAPAGEAPRPRRPRPARRRGPPDSWRRRSACGGARPWPSSPTSRGPRPRRPGWRSCAWPPPRPWSSCAWPAAGTPGWWERWRGWWRPTRPASGCGAS
jgi:DNA-binding winged helix-turn-helix (wHTH) protein